VEIDPPRRLVTTFHFPNGDPALVADRPSRVTWDIRPLGPTCLLTVTHDDFDGESPTYRAVEHGWMPVLSALKTLLETGAELEISARQPAEAQS
jgi:uncharacterized protein YndB with AHSA1/START domain